MTIFLTATQLEYQDPSLVAVPSMGATLLRLVLSLLIVIVLAFLVIKFFQRQMPFTRSGRWMRILDQVVIGQNRALLLTEIAGKIYVLGVTDHNITKLLEIDDASKVAQFSAEDLEAEEYSNSFWKKTLEHFFPGRGNNSIRSKDFGEGE
ncbi:MAG TPA: flagellar biosynthetic protein FliO [Syntrophomonadaceae bacterium]|nr:flagellar biosynthetic protein FliO [Syntrophomonadaceae bacterium]